MAFVVGWTFVKLCTFQISYLVGRIEIWLRIGDRIIFRLQMCDMCSKPIRVGLFENRHVRPGTDVMIFKIFSPKNFAKKRRFCLKTKLNFEKS
jgi:hypothetical protein